MGERGNNNNVSVDLSNDLHTCDAHAPPFSRACRHCLSTTLVLELTDMSEFFYIVLYAYNPPQ